VFIAAKFTKETPDNLSLILAVIKNPALLSFGIGVLFHDYPLPNILESSLQIIAWIILTMTLVLMGMRLSEIKSWTNINSSVIALIIKMLIVPLMIGLILLGLGWHGPAHLVLVLQMGMPPAFATLVIAEAYDLDCDLTVTSLALGALFLLFTLPLWLLLFPIS
ncbi:MAG TPA: AEC family transporter, partial [Allocoleopsis sp.]